MNRSRVLVIFLWSLFLPRAWAALSTKTTMVDFPPMTEWVNSAPLSLDQLKNKVTLIYFWKSSCYECINNFAFLRYLHHYYDYLGLTLVAVHVPEYDFERSTDSVQKIAERLKVSFPIAVDKDKILSNQFQVYQYPAFYLFDGRNRLREVHASQYAYQTITNDVQKLLQESQEVQFGPLDDDFNDITIYPSSNPPLITGYERLYGYGNEQMIRPDHPQKFKLPDYLHPYHFYLQGEWLSQSDRISSLSSESKIMIRFNQKVLSITAGAKGQMVIVKMRMNGMALDDKTQGFDVNSTGGTSVVGIGEYRLYTLVDMVEHSTDNTLELAVQGEGLEIFNIQFSDIALQLQKDGGITKTNKKDKVKLATELEDATAALP